MNTKILSIGVAILLITLSGTFYIIRTNNAGDRTINCTGQITVSKQSSKLTMNVLFLIDDRVSTVYLRGILNKDGKTYVLNRSIYARITSKNNHYRFITEKISNAQELPESAGPLADVLPKYLQSVNSPQDFFIYRLNPSRYVFTNGYIPSLYCKKLT
ncbi:MULTISPECIES: hypothetical protein [Tatumella]|uniref:FidL-like membrane protein n=1 Tax=Tatumella punctata TaxID=399969 RepID=A0ABW1VNW2_9GAMM|nr:MULTISPECIES: hypothetical protein [unclassified Tatumella]MBS0856596.1 hypothetical protein [Tatumella sp. JGM16]MBS0877919.1 hypothetical protein [Tatumella sp. JGM82]MBS0891625.1 hypothetical protein [Tatumella sp. JGM94]MBS0893830.1 hypothetical protein [Tatumella sp. JGM130]MBS0902551.1 hypothetical protein [Tatumella sp. JGM100]